MLDDILNFATDTLVDNGRLSFWMPTANDEKQEIGVPAHPSLEIVAVCTQPFNKCLCFHTDFSFHLALVDRLILDSGSRRLITYRRLPESDIDTSALARRRLQEQAVGTTADDLNPFRRVYFRGFKAEPDATDIPNEQE
jgi:tRNA (guanine10-N2)-methyltransferase